MLFNIILYKIDSKTFDLVVGYIVKVVYLSWIEGVCGWFGLIIRWYIGVIIIDEMWEMNYSS